MSDTSNNTSVVKNVDFKPLNTATVPAIVTFPLLPVVDELKKFADLSHPVFSALYG